jgi:N-acetylmuramoyl-L-alanine amidase
MNVKVCVLTAFFVSAVPAFAQSLTQQAAAQFRSAEKAEAALNDEPQANRSRANYLKVIRAYERVYLITPHTAFADNALTSIAHLYESMNDPKNAVKTLQFLLHEYPQTPFRDMVIRDIARLNRLGEPAVAVPAVSAVSAVPPVSKDSGSVENVRYWTENRSVKIVVDVAGGVTFKEGEAKSPQRFFVDISPARLNSALNGKEWVVDSKAIQKIRVAQFDDSTVRVVLDGPTTKDVTTANFKDPNRIVMDVAVPGAPAAPITTPPSKAITSAAPTTPAAPPVAPATAAMGKVDATPPASAPVIAEVPESPAAAATTTPVVARPEPNRVVTAAKPTSMGDRSLIRSLGLKLSRVVIDAGHGGHDTGSIGPTGFTEKELVLDVAKRLKALIEEQMGAEVVLTRDSDTFVALENRTQLANQEKADLFISIHANSSPEKTVRGVETFFLNLNTQSRDALATATRENAASDKKIHELQDILQKIVLNDKADESRELAMHVQTAMSIRTNAGSNRGVKQAPFVVLVGATMPSVLAEISFISNPDEEKRLKTPEYRQKIAESLYQGIKSYAETLSSTRASN